MQRCPKLSRRNTTHTHSPSAGGKKSVSFMITPVYSSGHGGGGAAVMFMVQLINTEPRGPSNVCGGGLLGKCVRVLHVFVPAGNCCLVY